MKIDISSLVSILSKTAQNSIFFLKADSSQYLPRAYFGFEPNSVKDLCLSKESALVSCFEKDNRKILRSQINNLPDKELLDRELGMLNAQVAFAIKAFGELFGLLSIGGNRTEHHIQKYELKFCFITANFALVLAYKRTKSDRSWLVNNCEQERKIIAKMEKAYKDDPEYHALKNKTLKYIDEFFAKEKENRNWRSLDFEERLIQVIMNFLDTIREGKTKEEAILSLTQDSKAKFDPLCVEAVLEMYKKGKI